MAADGDTVGQRLEQLDGHRFTHGDELQRREVVVLELDAHVAKVKGYKPNLLGKPRFDGVWLET